MTYRRPDPAELPPWRGRRIVAWAILPPDASQEELERVVDHLTADRPGGRSGTAPGGGERAERPDLIPDYSTGGVLGRPR